MKLSLHSLIGDEDVVEGKFLISESEQYMKRLDRLRLKAGNLDVFDYDTVERYWVSKGSSFDSIEDYFRFFGSAGSEIDVFNRVKNFDLKEWYEMRDSGQIRLGRFIRGKVRYLRDEEASMFAAIRDEPVLPQDMDLLGVISGMERASMRQLVSETGLDKDDVKESLMRLDRALKVVRAFNEKEDWGTENTYEVYNPEPIDFDPVPKLVEQSIRAYGPIPVMAMRHLLGIMPEDTTRVADQLGAKTIFVGDARTPMLIMPDEIEKLNDVRLSEDIIIMSLFDPVLSPKWAEISSRYGDKWIYPMVKGRAFSPVASLYAESKA